jgi:hypothetical protein
MNALIRTLRFVSFTLTEYARSGRILVETLVTLAVYYIFFRRWASPMPPSYFFTTAGLFLIALTFYTTSVMMGLGDRPQGYVVLMRRLGRAGYLIGFYLAALFVELAAYGLVSLGVAWLNPVDGLTPGGWLLGTLPLALNAALLGALLTLLAPMVLGSGWRLAILALVALAFSGNLVSGQMLSAAWPPLAQALNVLRTIVGTPLLPAFAGFSLAVTRDYTGVGAAIPVAQLSLAFGVLALALYAFARREIIFTG